MHVENAADPERHQGVKRGMSIRNRRFVWCEERLGFANTFLKRRQNQKPTSVATLGGALFRCMSE
jgi:hypothetical protein